MNASTVLFYVYALVAVAGAAGLVMARDMARAVMSLFATLVAIAALFLLLGNEFLAAMQLFVYGGAVTVLVLFALMLSRRHGDSATRAAGVGTKLAASVSLAFFAVLAFTLGTAEFEQAAPAAQDTAALATILFSRYVLPFEIAGLILTLALIGAVVLAREDHVTGTAEEA